MRRTGVCPKCGSSQILENARLLERGENNWRRDLEVTVYEKPEALLFKGRHTGVLRAWICTGCGYTELYCPDLF